MNSARAAAFAHLVAWTLSFTYVQAQVPAAPLQVVVLGSGGPGALGRASSSYVVLIDGTPRILVDAGSGSFVRMGGSKIALDALDIVLLTHLHIDHAAELPGLMKARAVSGSGPIVFKIFGPVGSPGTRDEAYFPSTSQFLNLLFASSYVVDSSISVR